MTEKRGDKYFSLPSQPPKEQKKHSIPLPNTQLRDEGELNVCMCIGRVVAGTKRGKRGWREYGKLREVGEQATKVNRVGGKR